MTKRGVNERELITRGQNRAFENANAHKTTVWKYANTFTRVRVHTEFANGKTSYNVHTCKMRSKSNVWMRLTELIFVMIFKTFSCIIRCVGKHKLNLCIDNFTKVCFSNRSDHL